MPNNVQEPDKLALESRKKLAMTGVQAVDGFTEQVLRLTVGGNKVVISGESIKITAYNKTTGTLLADGRFSEIKYLGTKTPFYKRIFK